MPSPSRIAARRVAAAQMISYTGTSAAYTALVYEVYRQTGSSAWVAGALLVTLGARGAMTPLAGTLGDRFHRRRVMIVSDLLASVSFLGMALVGSPTSLLALAFLATVVESPFFPASAAAIPNLVVAEDLSWANGTVAFGSSLGYLTGPALGGLLVAAAGAGSVFVVNAVSFLGSAVLVASVQGRFADEHTGGESHLGALAGLRFIRKDPVLWRMTTAFAVFAVSVGSILVAELPLAISFGAGVVGFGLLSTAVDLGGLGGALWARRLTPANERTWLVGASFVSAALLGAVSLMPAFLPILAIGVVWGASDGLVDVVVTVIYQRRSPDAVRSRVLGALEAVFLLGLAAAFPVGALLVDAFGPKVAYAVAGVGCTVTAAMLVPLARARPALSALEQEEGGRPGAPRTGGPGP